MCLFVCLQAIALCIYMYAIYALIKNVVIFARLFFKLFLKQKGEGKGALC